MQIQNLRLPVAAIALVIWALSWCKPAPFVYYTCQKIPMYCLRGFPSRLPRFAKVTYEKLDLKSWLSKFETTKQIPKKEVPWFKNTSSFWEKKTGCFWHYKTPPKLDPSFLYKKLSIIVVQYMALTGQSDLKTTPPTDKKIPLADSENNTVTRTWPSFSI